MAVRDQPLWMFEAEQRRRESAEKVSQIEPPIDKLQRVLDVAGMTPALGLPADLANAAISGIRGNKLEAGISLASAIPGFGLGSPLVKKAIKQAKAMEHNLKFKKYMKFKRREMAIDKGELLIANKKLESNVSIDKNGDMWSKTGPGEDAALAKIGNVYEMPKWERFKDHYDEMPEISKILESSGESLSPEELKNAARLTKSMTKGDKERMTDLMLRLDKLIPDVPKMKQGGQIPNSKVFSYLKNV